MSGPPDRDALPAELVGARAWCAWRLEANDNGKPTKVPYGRDGRKHDVQNSNPGLTFDEASALAKRLGGGVGFCFVGMPYAGVDLDAALEDGKPKPWAARVLYAASVAGCYVERSPSGSGVHAIGHLDDGRDPHCTKVNRPGHNGERVERFLHQGYFTVTGDVWNEAPEEIGSAATVLAAAQTLAGGWRNFAEGARPGREDLPEITLRADAEPPANLEALLENVPDARATWEGKRLPSASERDLAIASWCARAGWTHQETADAIIARRSHCGDDVRKAMRQDYMQATLAKAFASVAEDATEERPVTLESFYAYLPMHRYLYRPTGELWPAASVNSSIPPVRPKKSASTWLDESRPVQQMTWVPGEPELIRDRLIVEGGWFDHPGASVFNLYQPPRIQPGEPDKATRWRDLLQRVYPDDHEHITMWLAHRVQRPEEKLNHALVLGGPQGIGKDTLLEACRRGVGPWNFREVSPPVLMGRFNPFVKAVIMRVSEAHDLGEVSRFAFYEHLKTYTAAPPDVLRVDEKNIREYVVPNVCGVVVTTNNRDGVYLPPDDRRHYVAWSPLTKYDFEPDFWKRFWSWYLEGGIWHVVAHLQALDLANFDPKAPPPKTPAFWQFVDANRSPEDAELADALEDLGNPEAVTLGQIGEAAQTEAFRLWLGERKNAWAVRKRMEAVGYVSVRNPHTKDGVWKIAGRRQAVYARQELAPRDQIAAARALAEGR